MIHDLLAELSDLVARSTSDIGFRAHFWRWLDEHRSDGPLGALIYDMETLWSGVRVDVTLHRARRLVERLRGQDFPARARATVARVESSLGPLPPCEIVLCAGLGRPQGYSRFDGGRNTIFIGLDHPENIAHADHFEVILSHELTHAYRDPTEAVLADYGGSRDMTHDEFVARYPMREHLVSEALATALSERAFPGRTPGRYVYYDDAEYLWCEANRRAIADRVVAAVRSGEDYRTFYAGDAIAPGSPESCDYYLGFHLGRFALARAAPAELVRLPACAFLERYLAPFLEEFVREGAARTPPAATEPGAATYDVAPASGRAIGFAVLPDASRAFYQDLVADLVARPEMAGELQAGLAEGLARDGLTYGPDPAGAQAFAFPLVLAPGTHEHLRWVTEQVLRVIEKAVRLYRTDAAARAYLALPAPLERLARLEPPPGPAVPIGRFDTYWDGTRLRFLELNTNGTAAIPLAERLGLRFAELPRARDLLARHHVGCLRPEQALYDALERAWRSARPDGGGRPRVAILDWGEEARRPEHALMAAALRGRGLEARLASPEALVYEDGVLRDAAGPIDLVYRRLTTWDIIRGADRLEPFLRACEDGAVVSVGSFASDVAHSKRLFALLTDERFYPAFDPAERVLIDAHIPWTRIFRPQETVYEGRVHDLKELALTRRERFVLKPAERHEGRGVLLGAETPPDEWEAEVHARYGHDHIIQERVAAPIRDVYLPSGGGVEKVALHLHIGPCMVWGRLAGILARASRELVITATSRERLLPCLVIEGGAGDGEGGRTEDL